MKTGPSHISLIAVLLAIGFIFLTISCSKPKDDRPVLAVSIEPQRQILEELVGDKYRVVTIMPPSADPEAFDPSMATRADLEDSKIYFTIGGLPFENDLAMTINNKVNIVPTSTGIEPIYGTHGHSHSNFLEKEVDSTGMADPHYWVSVRNMRQITRNMTTELQRLDPTNVELYQQRYMAIDHRLDSLDKAFTQRLDSLPTRTFIVWHPTLSYFSRDYGLEQLAVTADNKDVSMRALRLVMQEAIDEKAKVFFSQGYCNAKQAQAIENGVGARRVDVKVTDYNWEEQLTKIVDELTRL